MGGLSVAPGIEFSDFQRRPTFNDGTYFIWEAKCSEEQVLELFKKLGMAPANESDKRYEMGDVNERANSNGKLTHGQAVTFYKSIFDEEPPVDMVWYSPNGFTGGYSKNDSLLRLMFAPNYR